LTFGPTDSPVSAAAACGSRTGTPSASTAGGSTTARLRNDSALAARVSRNGDAEIACPRLPGEAAHLDVPSGSFKSRHRRTPESCLKFDKTKNMARYPRVHRHRQRPPATRAASADI
jgi:hypothetical protein